MDRFPALDPPATVVLGRQHQCHSTALAGGVYRVFTLVVLQSTARTTPARTDDDRLPTRTQIVLLDCDVIFLTGSQAILLGLIRLALGLGANTPLETSTTTLGLETSPVAPADSPPATTTADLISSPPSTRSPTPAPSPPSTNHIVHERSLSPERERTSDSDHLGLGNTTGPSHLLDGSVDRRR